MSTLRAHKSRDLVDFRRSLTAMGYSPWTIHNYISSVRGFLRYLERDDVALEEADASHVTAYRRYRLRQYRQLHKRMPTCMNRWRAKCQGGIRHFLRLTLGDWPRLPPPQNAVEALIATWLAEYQERQRTYNDLASDTVVGRLDEAKRFLMWCNERGALGHKLDVSITDVDAYVQQRASHMRRVTCAHMTRLVRVFLQFLYATGKLPEDFSARVIGPTLYQYESIPSILDADQVGAVLRHCRQDHSPKGRRDYAILMLLATYGLRGGELVRLRLSDVDWRGDTLSIFHTKTRTHTTLPLLPAVGKALLAYLRHGRQKVSTREIFLRMKAPFRGLKRASCLNSMIYERLAAAGVRPPGKSGSHVFRHARAVTLLRAHVPVKTIADVLGHRAVRSTSVYLKLHNEELRSVALPLPISQGGAL
jgi:integrase/recombinase XerD